MTFGLSRLDPTVPLQLRTIPRNDPAVGPLLSEYLVRLAEAFPTNSPARIEAVRRLFLENEKVGLVLVQAGMVPVGLIAWENDQGIGLIHHHHLVHSAGGAARYGELLTAFVRHIGEEVRKVHVFSPWPGVTEEARNQAYTIARFHDFDRWRMSVLAKPFAEPPELPELTAWPFHAYPRAKAAELVWLAYRKSVDHGLFPAYDNLPSYERFCNTYYNDDLHEPTSMVWEDATGEAVGMVITYAYAEVAYIANICVHPAFQGRGLGRRLLRRMLHLYQENAFYECQLSVTARNEPARNLYLSEGFVTFRTYKIWIWNRGPGG